MMVEAGIFLVNVRKFSTLIFGNVDWFNLILQRF